jgi:hypothetical protein
MNLMNKVFMEELDKFVMAGKRIAWTTRLRVSRDKFYSSLV